MEEIVCAGKWTVKGVSSSKSVRVRCVHFEDVIRKIAYDLVHLCKLEMQSSFTQPGKIY